MSLPPIFGFVVAVLLLALVVVASAAAVYVLVRSIRATKGGESIAGHAPQLVLFAFILGLFAAASFGVGKAYELLTEGWASVVGVVGTLFGGWLGYKAATKISSKGATLDSTPTETK